MKKHIIVSPPQRSDEQQDLEQHYFKLMQHPVTPAHRLVSEINQIIASSTPTDEMLQEIARLVVHAFKVDYCSLVTHPQQGEEPTTASWSTQDTYLGLPNSNEAFSIEQLELPVVQCAAEPFTIEDISTIQESLVIGCQNFPLPIKAVLAIPTRFGGENNGVINLIKSEPYEWSNGEKELLKAVESCCACAFAQIAQARVISSQKQQVRKSEQHQSLIQQLTILNRSNLEFSQMLQLVVSSTAEALGADRGLLILLKYSDPLFRIRNKTQIPKAKATVVSEWCRETDSSLCDELKSIEESFWLADCGISQRAFKASKPVTINDNSDRRKDTSTIAPIFVLDKLPAIMLMPLESQGKVLGFLVLQQRQRRNWQEAELNIVEMVCVQISNAIIQTQTLKQVQTLVDERTAQLQRSLEVQAKLYERTRQYVQQLRELNELKDEFLSNMSDRLRYPLTNMRMALRNLRHPDIQPDRQTRYLDILEQECTKEINLINDLLTLQKLESHQERPQFETVDLNIKIQGIAASFEQKLAEKGLSISVYLPPEELKLQTEVESFDRILQELLTNTSKYSEHNSSVELQVTQICETQANQIQIQVINVGRGISEEEATFIFDKFRRGKGRWTPGTGLGLALVKSLIQHLNGTITVESTSIENSELSKICFTLTLPQFSDDTEVNELS
ncbi:MAG: GAF domain-containing sensor histidine kinase [Richelia sp. RM2_1_2]|nr:GAF domain-containing sensor histidine kinase [Richelia sp. SM2_1_7]NJM21929.1 GAF domain-containing sensor histidine kinase [Richelia sp. SM1_7_0]NJN10397.1 GAF domain-containing sensor histidine kinase [Richelia sp. RM1_1_1]NJO60928.1 GAF domain-containing sensor histidine kinase [Richelia sp. RM2_1_2]